MTFQRETQRAWPAECLSRSSTWIAAFFLLSAFASLAAGQAGNSPPNFDTRVSCTGAPDVSACRDMEQQARAQIGRYWAQASQAQRATCAARARDAARGGSYITLLSCLRPGG